MLKGVDPMQEGGLSILIRVFRRSQVNDPSF